MNTHADKTPGNKGQATAGTSSPKRNNSDSTAKFIDNRAEGIAQRKLQEDIDNSPRVQQLKAYQEIADGNQQVKQERTPVNPTVQLKGKVNVNDDAGLEKEADVMGAKAVGLASQTHSERKQLKESVISNSQTVQAVLHINRVKINISKVDVLVKDAYEYGQLSMHLLSKDLVKPNLKQTLLDWIASKPFELPGNMMLGSIKPSIGLEDDQPKAHWKSFPDNESFFKQLIYDSNPALLKNRETEVALATQVLGNDKVAGDLNELRRTLGKHFWQKESIFGKMSYYLTTNPIANLLPNMGGSYNLANSYPKLRDEPNIDDLGSIKPLLQQMFIKEDRMSLLFSEKDFSVSENIAILHDVKELFSQKGNSRALPTAHPKLVPHPYQGVNSPAKPTRWEQGEDLEPFRVDVLRKGQVKDEIKWDQGRLGAGTRNENSPDTKTARKTKMPIETGRSHTAARLFEMVSLLKPADDAEPQEHERFAKRMKAIAYGIFGYWNAENKDGGYPKSLTPVHTYHEVMDPAEDYLPGIYKQPFSYEDLKDYLKE